MRNNREVLQIMTGSKVTAGLRTYQNSKWSAADDDRLAQLIRDVPIGIALGVSGISTDSAGGTFLVKMSAEKAKEDQWRVREHWIFETGSLISDKTITQSLTWLLRCRHINIDCFSTFKM